MYFPLVLSWSSSNKFRFSSDLLLDWIFCQTHVYKLVSRQSSAPVNNRGLYLFIYGQCVFRFCDILWFCAYFFDFTWTSGSNFHYFNKTILANGHQKQAQNAKTLFVLFKRCALLLNTFKIASMITYDNVFVITLIKETLVIFVSCSSLSTSSSSFRMTMTIFSTNKNWLFGPKRTVADWRHGVWLLSVAIRAPFIEFRIALTSLSIEADNTDKTNWGRVSSKNGFSRSYARVPTCVYTTKSHLRA